MDHVACMTAFVAVVEKGGFAAAARHLGIAPPTVSQQIQALEERIGARLLQRTTRKSTLTQDGQAFYARGIKILEDIKEADAVANTYHVTAKRTVRLNTSPTLVKDVSTLVARYLTLYPETSFDLTATSDLIDFVDDRIDLAIRDDSVPESSLIVRRLAFAEWTPCASPGYVARHGMPIHPEELAEHNCLVHAIRQGDDQWRFMNGNSAKSIRVSGTLRSSDAQALREAALCDQGLILLPDATVAEDLQTGQLVRILNGYCAEQATVRAVFPSRQRLAPKVRAFLDFAAMDFGTPEFTGTTSHASRNMPYIEVRVGACEDDAELIAEPGVAELPARSTAKAHAVMAYPAATGETLGYGAECHPAAL
jgi:DNA-binding transcriptional LysR family regulator